MRAETVEKNILDLAARRGLSLYTKENARGTLDVTPLANAAVKEAESLTLAKRANKPKGGQKGDFVFRCVRRLPSLLAPSCSFFFYIVFLTRVTCQRGRHAGDLLPAYV